MTTSAENMKVYRLGFFANDLALMLGKLTADELQAALHFMLEYLLAGATGLVDDDANLIRRTHCKRWPQLKKKLVALGLIQIEEGIIHNGDLEHSVQKQRNASERGRKGAKIRWSAGRIGGEA